MRLEIHPLTPDRWQDMETLFGEHGAYGGCWCMYWRLPRKDYVRQRGEENRKLFKGIVEKGIVPGLLAYVDENPAAWIALAPRVDYPVMQRSRVIAPVDEQPVWSVSCFYTAKAHRHQGLTVFLLKAAVAYAAQHGARIIEGYPTDPGEKSHVDAYVYTGLASAFIQAGFKEVLRRAEKRPIMRYFVE